MLTAADLRRAVERALAFVREEPGVREAEVFAVATRSLLTRLNYTSHIPCNGVEEPKSTESDGLGLHVAFDHVDGPRVGFGSEPGALGLEAAARALDKAARSAVKDPDFRSLPRPTGERRSLADYHDLELFAITDERLVHAGWSLVTGGLGTFSASSRFAELAGSEVALRQLGLVLGGDLHVRQERIAIASSHMPRVQTDESAVLTSDVTAMVEAHEAKGAGWTISTRLHDCTDEAGSSAAARAIAAIGGQRVPAGDFTCTVVGDSWLIRDGRLAAPIKANAIRINDNLVRVLESVFAIGRDRTATVVWGTDEVVYAPAIAVAGVHVDEIAGMERLG